MRLEDVKPAQAAVSMMGERTRAYVILELLHDGHTVMTSGGDLISVSWLSKTLDFNLAKMADRAIAEQQQRAASDQGGEKA